MNTTIRKSLMGFVVIIPLLLANQAGAALSGPFTTTTPVTATLTDWSSSLAFQQFDSALGTLTGVELYLSSSFDTTLTVHNGGTANSSGWVNTEVMFTLTDPLLADSNLDYSTTKQTFVNLAPGGTLTMPQANRNQSSDVHYTSPAVLSQFTGPGTINLGLFTTTYTGLSYNGGVIDASQVTHAGASGWVTYTYTPTPVPEPTTVIAGAMLVLVTFGASTRRIIHKLTHTDR